MILDLITKLNWIDLLLVFIAVRILYIGAKKGLLVELFKVLGILAAIYLSMHYYTFVSDFFNQRLNLKVIPLDFLDFLVFMFLAGVGYLLFLVLREVCTHLVKMEAIPTLNKWGGLIVSTARVVLFTGLIIFGLTISCVNYLKESVEKSFSGAYLYEVAPSVYSWVWNNISSKIMSQEEFNKTIQKMIDDFNTPVEEEKESSPGK